MPSLLKSTAVLSTLNTSVPPKSRAVPMNSPYGVAAKLRLPVLLPSPKPVLLTNVQWIPSGVRHKSVPYSCDHSGPKVGLGTLSELWSQVPIYNPCPPTPILQK